jgi:hypothetical protein
LMHAQRDWLMALRRCGELQSKAAGASAGDASAAPVLEQYNWHSPCSVCQEGCSLLNRHHCKVQTPVPAPRAERAPAGLRQGGAQRVLGQGQRGGKHAAHVLPLSPVSERRGHAVWRYGSSRLSRRRVRQRSRRWRPAAAAAASAPTVLGAQQPARLARQLGEQLPRSAVAVRDGAACPPQGGDLPGGPTPTGTRFAVRALVYDRTLSTLIKALRINLETV